jgi:hypothetical protein
MQVAQDSGLGTVCFKIATPCVRVCNTWLLLMMPGAQKDSWVCTKFHSTDSDYLCSSMVALGNQLNAGPHRLWVESLQAHSLVVFYLLHLLLCLHSAA